MRSQFGLYFIKSNLCQLDQRFIDLISCQVDDKTLEEWFIRLVLRPIYFGVRNSNHCYTDKCLRLKFNRHNGLFLFLGSVRLLHSSAFELHTLFYKKPLYKEPTCRMLRYLKSLYY